MSSFVRSRIASLLLAPAAVMASCERAPRRASPPVPAVPTVVSPVATSPLPRRIDLADDLAASPAFHAQLEPRASGAPFAADVPQVRHAASVFDSLPVASDDPFRGVLVCRVQLSAAEPWDPGRWNARHTPADVTATVTLGGMRPIVLPMPEDLDTPTFSIPDVELRVGDAITVVLVDRDFTVADEIATVRLRWTGEVPVDGVAGPARVSCRMMLRADAEENARRALLPLDTELARLAARSVDLLAEDAVPATILDTLHTCLRDAASYVGYADPIVRGAIDRTRPFEAGRDAAVARAIAEASARLSAPGEPIRLGRDAAVVVRGFRCESSAPHLPLVCRVDLEETHRRIPTPPGFVPAVSVRLLGPDGASITCTRVSEVAGESMFIQTTEPRVLRHECRLPDGASWPEGRRLLILGHDGRRVLARVD